MAWNDKIYESRAREKTLEAVKQLDLGDAYRWDSFQAYVVSGHREYDCKVEYLVRHGVVRSVIVTCLQSPMADFDITESLSKTELERIYDLAEHHREQHES